MKPAGHSEQASLNQYLLIALNLCSVHVQLMLAIRFHSNENDARALVGPSSHMFRVYANNKSNLNDR